MPEWNQGYFTEITYSKNVFNELSPAYLNFCLALSSQTTVDLDKPFTYAELGAGFGLSSLGLAAMYPQGRFFAVDFNPSQTAWAQKVAEAAELDNIKIFERSFNQMLAEDLPPLDYVVLHGIYSWVTPEVRADIRNFIVKFLKPGGAAYLSYNSQPGWSAAEPMRDFLLALRQSASNNQPQAVLNQGLGFLKDIEEAGGLYFKTAVNAGNWLTSWTKADPSYLFGELFTKEHRAFPFAEIVSDMSEAKTIYAGSADTTNYLDEVITPQPFLKCLEKVAGNLVLKETAKGLLYNTAFRRDIFVKGPQALDRARGEAALKEKSLALVGQRITLPEKVSIKGIELTLRPEVYNPLLDILDQGPATLGRLVEKTGLNISQVAQAAAIILALGWAHPLPPEAPDAVARITKFNLALDDVLGSEVFGYILSRYGYWRNFGPLERLYVLARMQERDPEDFILETCRARGWKVMREGQEVNSPEEGRQAVREQLDKITEQLPWLNKRLWGEGA